MDKKDIHKLVLQYVSVLFGVIFLTVAMGAVSRWGGSLAPARTLTVSADGKTTATPDLAEVSFSVVSQGKDPNTLNADNNQAMNKVIDFVKSLNVASSDITTVNYDLEPNYETNTVTVPQPILSPVSPQPESSNADFISGGSPIRTISSSTISGYTLTQTVQVKIRDFTNIAKLLGGLPPLGVNNISGVTFTFDNSDKFLAVARADAMTKASVKAGQMAGEAGVSLGKVVSVQEYGNVPVYSSYAKAVPMAAGVSSAEVTPTIEPGTQDITDQVTIVYELK
jgi:uncharacterized protein YggE